MGRTTVTNTARRRESNNESHFLRAASALVVLCVLGANAFASPPEAASTSRASRLDAVRSIPFDEFDPDARAKATSVINRTTVFRRLPTQVVDCDPLYFIFLVRRPEIVVNIWRQMKATDLVLKRRGPESFFATDNAGTVGNLEFLYGDNNTHVMYCQGSYTGSLTARPVRADCLLVLKSEYIPYENGRHYVASRIDLFMTIHNAGLDLLARTFQGMIGKTTDENFVQTANFVTRLARTTESNGPGVQRLASQLKDLDPNVRQSFYEMAGTVYQNALQRVGAPARGQAIQPVSRGQTP